MAISVRPGGSRTLPRPRSTTARGFTLVELLIVVAMVGVLAALAIVGYRRYMDAAKSGEAKDIIGAIHVAQESYRAETLGYLDCSANLASWYPGTPDSKKRHWVQPGHGERACWQTLNVAVDSPTRYGFAVVAGSPGDDPNATAAPSTNQKPTWPNPATSPWYVVQAAGDNDDDNTLSYFVSSSFAPSEIYVENESE
ncbi:MAG: prepilin-type N-terminal cleavage/methylation domain-containing protein [Deltaproteobacteria bacterium]|nr:prepilin-type N-terminal cleavage/methylation domain-containing protein [Deltaproteobacteria bacterium]MBW2537603.1 prepilin-type N-terminal cleavage/methylation domain-containing protein [Deltaproteobacteria bacterium]